MSDFNPDSYLAKKPKFDPDAYLSKRVATEPSPAAPQEVPPVQKQANDAGILPAIVHGGSSFLRNAPTKIAGAIEGATQTAAELAGKGYLAMTDPQLQTPEISLSKNIANRQEKALNKGAALQESNPQSYKFGKGLVGAALIASPLKSLGVAGGLSSKAAGTLAGGATNAILAADNKDATAKTLAKEFAIGTLLGAVGEYGPGIVKQGLKKVGEYGKMAIGSMKGLDKNTVNFYAHNRKAVNSALKSELEELLPTITDSTVNKLSTFVKDTKGRLNNILAQHDDQLLPTKTLIDDAYASLQKITKDAATPIRRDAARLWSEQIKQIEEAFPDGAIRPTQLQDLKIQLQEQAHAFWDNKDVRNDIVDASYASLSKVAKNMLEKVSGDESVAALNKSLENAIKQQKILGIGNVFKNGLDPKRMQTIIGKSQAAELGAMRDLDRIAGTNISGLRNLYRTTRDLKSNDFLSNIKTGRSLMTGLLGAATGGASGNPIGGAAGGMVGMALGSPVGTKAEITLSKAMLDAARKSTPALKAVPAVGIATRESKRE